jgi:hypothetical protein
MTKMVAVTALLVLCVVSVGAWGADGHKMIARIAQSRLTASTLKQVEALIGGEMSTVATWADEVRHEPEWAWSAPLHFINTPDRACNFEYSRDCKSDQCVAGAINNFTSQLAPTEFSRLSDADRVVALKFVIHFVGDIHQPLHCGFTSDLGGNTIDVRYEAAGGNRSTNLHSTWDSQMIYTYEETLGTNESTNWELMGDKLSNAISSSEEKSWGKYTGKTSVNTWGSESVADACSKAYKDTSGNWIKSGAIITEKYYSSRIVTVKERLSQGGVRLAILLNKAFGT